MAEKKFLDLTGLTAYDAKIKGAVDEKVAAKLAEAKAYADGLASNYDAAGSAATAQAEAIKQAKAYADGKDASIRAAADAAKKAQTEVDALETLVGTLPPSETVNTVVKYIDEKTKGIVSNEAVQQLTTRVTAAEGEIDAIQADYLKKADKTELQGKITGVEGKVTTLIGSDASKSVRTIANEELAAQLIPESAQESMNTLKEIADWIQKHPADASTINSKIAALEGKAHTHTNQQVLDGITAPKVAAWDGAEAKAKAYADSKIAEFVAISTEEINALFAPKQ